MQMAKRTRVTPRAVRQVLETAPLEGLQIAMSLSEIVDSGDSAASAANDFIDTTVFLARTLIGAGASIGYGGDFRTNGFTRLLAEVIRTYNETATRPAQHLHSYLAAPIELADAPRGCR